MEKEKIDRINALSRLSKTRALTEAEQAEQKALRAEYVRAVCGNLEAQLGQTYIQRPDGTREKLKKKDQ